MVPGLAAAQGAATTATNVSGDVGSAAKGVSNFFSKNGWYIIGGVVIIFMIITVILYFVFKPTPKPNPAPVVNTLGTGAANSPSLTNPTTNLSKPATKSGFQSGPEGFQMPAVPPQPISADETTFINLQPLAIKDAGFLGPYPNGSFDVVTATGNALKAGFRFLTLQIDYLDSSKPGFEGSGNPTLVVRDTNGNLLSTNSGSILDVATTVANMGFRPEVPHNLQPIILYLHVIRAPNKNTAPNDYIRFLSKIAKALRPLSAMHLGLTPIGNFTRQKQAETLLVTPLQSMQGQVIILSNADTTLFRSTSTALERYDPAEDLDFWVNMRVFLDSEEDSLGITELSDYPQSTFAVVADLNRLLKLSDAKASKFAGKSKNTYVIAMPSRTTNPTAKDVDTAINVLGVNAVPIDIFTDKYVTNLVAEYSNMPYHPKPVALRSISY